MDLEITKMTAKGQITLPIAIRKRLGLTTGDKVGFILDGGGIQVVNVSALTFGAKGAEDGVKAEHAKKENPL
jgi:AbrB family looped-hinge helix DNA binding protein